MASYQQNHKNLEQVSSVKELEEKELNEAIQDNVKKVRQMRRGQA